MKNIKQEYENYKLKLYEVSNIEFEILSCRLSLKSLLSKEQLALFEKYDLLQSKLTSLKENLAINYAIETLKEN